MSGLLLSRVACWWRGHTYAFKFRDDRNGRTVPGYVCTDCLHWKRSPFAKEAA